MKWTQALFVVRADDLDKFRNNGATSFHKYDRINLMDILCLLKYYTDYSLPSAERSQSYILSVPRTHASACVTRHFPLNTSPPETTVADILPPVFSSCKYLE